MKPALYLYIEVARRKSRVHQYEQRNAELLNVGTKSDKCDKNINSDRSKKQGLGLGLHGDNKVLELDADTYLPYYYTSKSGATKKNI